MIEGLIILPLIAAFILGRLSVEAPKEPKLRKRNNRHYRIRY